MPVNTGSVENQSTIGTKFDIAVGDKTDSIFLSQTKDVAEDPESGEASDMRSKDAEMSVFRGFFDTDESADKSSNDAKASADKDSGDADVSVDKGSESMSESEKKYASMLKNREFQPEDDKSSS